MDSGIFWFFWIRKTLPECLPSIHHHDDNGINKETRSKRDKITDEPTLEQSLAAIGTDGTSALSKALFKVAFKYLHSWALKNYIAKSNSTTSNNMRLREYDEIEKIDNGFFLHEFIWQTISMDIEKLIPEFLIFFVSERCCRDVCPLSITMTTTGSTRRPGVRVIRSVMVHVLSRHWQPWEQPAPRPCPRPSSKAFGLSCGKWASFPASCKRPLISYEDFFSTTCWWSKNPDPDETRKPPEVDWRPWRPTSRSLACKGCYTRPRSWPLDWSPDTAGIPSLTRYKSHIFPSVPDAHFGHKLDRWCWPDHLGSGLQRCLDWQTMGWRRSNEYNGFWSGRLGSRQLQWWPRRWWFWRPFFLHELHSWRSRPDMGLTPRSSSWELNHLFLKYATYLGTYVKERETEE